MEEEMRVLLAGIFALGLSVLPATARTSKASQDADRKAVAARMKTTATAARDASKTDSLRKSQDSTLREEQRQLRELLASQSKELEATREQLQQLQRRMEFLEKQLPSRSDSRPATDIAAAPSASEVSADAGLPTTSNQGYGNVPAEEKNTFLSVKISDSRTSTWSPTRPGVPATTNGVKRAADWPTDQELKSDSISLANGKVRIGTLLYGDYAYYTKTGFGPQFLSQINPPGPGNNSYNTFEISRAYINLFYSPSDAVTFRLTPDLYRQIGAAPATKVGKVSAIGPNTDQELGFRVKYAYVDFNSLFARSDAFKRDKLTIGQQQDALIEWEEHLYGYRYTSLVPWDYLGLPSAVAGIKLQGPIELTGRSYLDYSIGVFNTASYKQLEQSEKKQAMARLTVYPFGARSNYDGLGFTGFYDYGYFNVTPDSGVNLPLYRAAVLAHYTFKKNAYEIAGEFDAGRNAFTSGNFFSGSGPQDEFGVGTTQFADFDALIKALQNGNGTKQRGYVAFGHAQIPRSSFTLFGMYHYFQPNTNVIKNPLDFSRIVAGISYKASDRLRFALTSQNLIFQHSQFTFPATELQLFSPSLAAANPNGIPNAVPSPIQAILMNTEFNF
jgi:hypothetical protein